MDNNVIDAGFDKLVEPKNNGDDVMLALSVISQWRKILNARMLAGMALIGALAAFTFAMYDPSTLRLIGASLYSVSVLWPVMWLFIKKA